MARRKSQPFAAKNTFARSTLHSSTRLMSSPIVSRPGRPVGFEPPPHRQMGSTALRYRRLSPGTQRTSGIARRTSPANSAADATTAIHSCTAHLSARSTPKCQPIRLAGTSISARILKRGRTRNRSIHRVTPVRAATALAPSTPVERECLRVSASIQALPTMPGRGIIPIAIGCPWAISTRRRDGMSSIISRSRS